MNATNTFLVAALFSASWAGLDLHASPFSVEPEIARIGDCYTIQMENGAGITLDPRYRHNQGPDQEDQVDPPYSGTVWIDPDIITPSDPTALVSVTNAGRGQRTMFDQRVKDWIVVNAYLFVARFDDGLTAEIQVNPEFGSASAARAEAEKYGRAVGQIPTVLRTNVETVWIHKGNAPLGGGRNNILIHTDLPEDYLEEGLIHEGAHTSLDPPWMGIVDADEWRAAQTADGNFISDYARDFPEREDIAESFLPYLAVRYRSARISRSYERNIVETMPNRIAYFDRLLQAQSANAMHPIRLDLRQPLSFAHFANGGSIASDLVLVNVEPSATYPAIYFHDQMGELIAPESVVDVTEDMEIREDGALTTRTGIEPLGELVISTHGRGELVTGSVTVFSDIVRFNIWGDKNREDAGGTARLGGVLRYGVPGVGVTGVGAGTPVRDALFPAGRKQGGIRTAAAMHNLGEEAIDLTCHLMSGGAVLEEVGIPLEPNGQRSWFIEEAFTATDTTDFVGTVRCTAPGEEMFTGLAVEVDAANRIFTTLPVVAVERTAGEGGPTVLHFAHFANGGNPDEEGIRSELVFVNVQTEASRPATLFSRAIPASRPMIYFYDQQGRKIDPESVVDVAGNLEVTEDGALTVGTEMAPLGELAISTHGRGAEVSGSVKVVSEGPIGGVLRYSVPGVGVTGVGAGLPMRDALFPARRKEGGIRTAAAMRNLGEEAIEVSCRLMSGGAVLEETEIPLAGKGQTSWFIEEEFTETDTTDFVGSVRCTAPGEEMFTGLAVEVDAANRIFTTLPVAPIEERMFEE